MKTAILSILLAVPALASTEGCPNLKGEYFCKAVAGSHKDMVMLVRQYRYLTRMMYEYTYDQVGEPTLRLDFLASDQGEKNPDQDGMIGYCMKGYYYNIPKGGHLEDNSLLNYINADGNYEVIRNKGHASFLLCKRRK